MFGGGGRPSSESFWPDPPQPIPARRLIGKSTVHGFVKVMSPDVKKVNFTKSKADAAVKVAVVKTQSANAKASLTTGTTAAKSKAATTSKKPPSTLSTSPSRPSSSSSATTESESVGGLLDALYPPKPKAESDGGKTRMPRGTAGTWRGRRPPKTPAKLQEWLARKAAWEASRPKPGKTG
jgi:hypothetical protein